MLMAFSTSPADSTSAARQSLKPAPVRSRNSFTRCAGICVAGCCVLILFSLSPMRISWARPVVRLDAPICKTARRLGCVAAPGLLKSYASAICLSGFLVGRNGCLRRLGGFRSLQRDFAFDEIAFLFFVLLVRAGVDVLDAFDQRLVRSGLLVGDLGLLVKVMTFQHGFRNF